MEPNSLRYHSYKISNCPSDSISDLHFCNEDFLLGATSWDGSFNIWSYDEHQSQYKHVFEYYSSKNQQKNAYLRFAFQEENHNCFLGTSGGHIQLLNLDNFDASTIGSCSGIISGMRWVSQYSILISCSSDSKLICWDMRVPYTHQTRDFDLSGKVTNIDFSGQHLYIAFNDGSVGQFDIRNGELISIPTQFRGIPLLSISALPNDSGFFGGFMHGYSYLITKEQQNYYQCHRSLNNVFSVNSVAVDPQHQNGLSGGGNGTLAYYNFANNKIQEFCFTDSPITHCVFSQNNVIAVATGYDWKEGIEFYKQFHPEVAIHILRIN